ncbi:unnamed protein product [Darwinula stevensoni]|uniref:Uncharacterized protein n=1 Tax=Darwinula stevensoni TaxID=69355 RepID=A0A7R9FPV5_9CRUS|nr:unnamed protein product [Darwinula stevensoni]CAG0898594.1 unnamed protein product [Darwinula stevensoni]
MKSITDFLIGLMNFTLGVTWESSRQYRLQDELRPESRILVLEVPFPNDEVCFLQIITIPPDVPMKGIQKAFLICHSPSALWVALPADEKSVVPETVLKMMNQHRRTVPIQMMITRVTGSFECKDLDFQYHSLHVFNSSMLPNTIMFYDPSHRTQHKSRRELWKENESSYKTLLSTLLMKNDITS